eukprot:669995-Rhodomonas_salina.3
MDDVHSLLLLDSPDPRQSTGERLHPCGDGCMIQVLVLTCDCVRFDARWCETWLKSLVLTRCMVTMILIPGRLGCVRLVPRGLLCRFRHVVSSVSTLMRCDARF